MVKIKSKETIKRNFQDSIGRVPNAYKTGIEGTTGFIEAAVNAEPLYAQRTQEAISAQRRKKSLERLTDNDWKQPAMDKGAARIGPGMTASVDKQAAEYAPYHSALEGLVLPDRVADPDTNVDNRVKPVVRTLVATKKGIKG